MGVGFLGAGVGVVFFGVTTDCLGAGNSGVFESKAKNSSQLLSTIVNRTLKRGNTRTFG
jgi:hypothetical protein